MEQQTGRIDTWDDEKGYGYVESEGRRLFLHVRDFTERHKKPEAGDMITFSLGSDRKGRPCAVNALHRNDGGRLRLAHVAIVVALLVMPAVAILRFGELECWFLAGWITVASAITYWLYANDKKRARAGAWQATEFSLHTFGLLGGWPGAFLAQRHLRHKCSKLSFQFVFWLTVALHQFIAVDSLLEWRMTQAGLHAMQQML